MSDTAERLRLLTWAAVVLFVAYGVVYVTGLDFTHGLPRDGKLHVVGRDFLNFWMYGRAAGEPNPGRYYDLATYWAATDAITGPGYPQQLWSYPPTVMLLAAPFGLMAYLPALALWTAIGIAIFIFGLRLWTRDPRYIVPLLLSPAAIFGLVSGQLALVVTAAMLAVLRWRETRPLLAGVTLGLLTLKPQLGLFFPVLLLATRSWKIIAAAAVTGIGLALITGLIWGSDVWFAYLNHGIANQTQILTDSENLSELHMATLFINARSAGLTIAAAGAVQAVASVLAVVLVWITFARRPPADDLRANAIFLACAAFGTPYMMSYDTLPLVVAMVLLMPMGTAGRLLTLLAWGLQPLQFAFGLFHLPGPALVPIIIALYLVKQPASSTWVDQRNWPTGRTQASA
ncbi:glycosyltransferase family 87 protein [Sphingomonas sp.]|uniref:glycosyltransferase family 87 protein n=1 Tax=Sphingomonas sp. TaxID=28214 RepID=UPI00286C29AB|nr:glycosyltransferase family 87 protein [Sphingomonas sp.]